MGPLLTFIGLVIFAIVTWRKLSGVKRTVDAVKRQAQPRQAQPRPAPKQVAQTLEKDPKSGVYRPRQD